MKLPVDKILAMKNAVVVFKGRNVYRVRPSGEPFDLEPTMVDEKVEPLTATAAIGEAQYVFQVPRKKIFSGHGNYGVLKF